MVAKIISSSLTIFWLFILLTNQSFATELTVNWTTLWSAPNARSKIIGEIKKGEKFEVLEIKEKWVKIKFEGREAWVYKDLTSLGERQKKTDLQKERREFIREMIRKGVFYKVEVPRGGLLPRLWVAPGFYMLDFLSKQEAVSAVYAYYYHTGQLDNLNELLVVIIKDSMTGKKLVSIRAYAVA